MRSFAVWYNKKDKSKVDEVKADIHVNFWSQLTYETNPELCFFDFGIKIEDLSNVDFINIYCPFQAKPEDIKDLGGKISNNCLIDAIFNEDYSVTEGIAKYYIVQRADCKDENNDKVTDKFIVYSLNDTSEIIIKTCNREKVKPDDPRDKKVSLGTIISLKVGALLDNATGLAKGIKSYYFRIRVVTTKQSLRLINKKIENINIFKEYLESIELMDLRINDIRSCCDEVRNQFNIGSVFFVKSIHLLVMRKVNEEVSAEGNTYDCRLLEKDIWNKYIDKLDDNFIAYHFKRKQRARLDDDINNGIRVISYPVENMVILLKLKYKKIIYSTVLKYCLYAVGLAAFSNLVYDIFRFLFNRFFG